MVRSGWRKVRSTHQRYGAMAQRVHLCSASTANGIAFGEVLMAGHGFADFRTPEPKWRNGDARSLRQKQHRRVSVPPPHPIYELQHACMELNLVVWQN